MRIRLCMKIFYLFLIFIVGLKSYADQFVSEVPISKERKLGIESTLKAQLKDKYITQQQYDQEVKWLYATPCNGIDRSLSESQKTDWAITIAKQLKFDSVDINQAFTFKGWHIIYIDNHFSDEPYLFYSGNPTAKSNSVTSWSGAATIFETSEIEQSILQNAPGIPRQLASCFAWHVTLNRD